MTDDELRVRLGPSFRIWEELIARLTGAFQPLTHEWKTYSQKSGPTLRLLQKKRALLYLIPRQECFDVSVVLGPRAVEAAKASDLPGSVIREIESAKPYPEGTPVRIEVRNDAAIESILRLVRIKLN